MHAELLEGIRVVDFTAHIVGTLTTKTLADYGAEVIRIQSQSRPETAPEGPAGHIDYNTSKLSVTLNLQRPKAVGVAKRLVARADIVVENFAGGVMSKMGLGYEDMRTVNPAIIMLSSCMQGQTGPHASLPGFGAHLTALSGVSYITGWPDRAEPVWIQSYTDFVAPSFNTLAIMAALDYRARTGKGQYLDASQFENAVHFMAPVVLDYATNHRVSHKAGNRQAYAVPHGAYRCRGDERWCAIAIFTDTDWGSFCQAVGNPVWTREPRFATTLQRKQNEDELDRLVEAWSVEHSAEEIMRFLQSAGVAAGVLQTGEDLVENDPQLRHRNYFREIELPERGKHRTIRPSFVMSKSLCEVRRPPLVGEHNEYVLKGILGMSDEDIAELVLDGAIA